MIKVKKGTSAWIGWILIVVIIVGLLSDFSLPQVKALSGEQNLGEHPEMIEVSMEAAVPLADTEDIEDAEVAGEEGLGGNAAVSGQSAELDIPYERIDEEQDEEAEETPVPEVSGSSIEPVVHVVMNGEEVSQKKVYRIDRTATVTVTCEAVECVEVSVVAVTASGEPVQNSYSIQDWNSEGSVYTTDIHFEEDARYTWSIAYVSGEGAVEIPVTSDGNDVFAFTIDKTAPEAKLSFINNKNEPLFWNKLMNVLTFGLWKKDKVTIDMHCQDAMTGITEIAFYKAENIGLPLTAEDIKALYAEHRDVFEIKTGFSTAPGADIKVSTGVEDEKKFVIYARIEDAAGNVKYISTDGLGVDHHEPAITLHLEEPEGNHGIYNQDTIQIQVNVKDDVTGSAVSGVAVYSGINTVEYWVECDGVLSDVTMTNVEKLEQEFWEGIISIDAQKYNGRDVKVWVKAVDNAGNSATGSTEAMDIDTTKPEIQVSYENEEVKNIVDENGIKRGYFDKKRTATITITERADHFDALSAVSGVSIQAKDYNGQDIALDIKKMLGKWETVNGATPDQCQHKIKITYDEEANYDFDISYSDLAGNKSAEVVYKNADNMDSVTPQHFTIDKTAPAGSVFVSSSNGSKEDWTDVLSSQEYTIGNDSSKKDIIFNKWTNGKIQVIGEFVDTISPTIVEYYKTNAAELLILDELEELYQNQKFEKFDTMSIENEEQAVFYFRIADYAGHCVYMGSNGYILDKKNPKLVLIPEAANEFGCYNHDVSIQVQTEEEDIYSGIHSIWYTVESGTGEDKKITREETIYQFENENPTQKKLEKECKDKVIVVNAEENNSRNVVVCVYIEDNAGNIFSQEQKLDIDVTQPEIEVSYNHDDANCYKAENERGYFPAQRTATITITERDYHFNEQDIINGITIQATDRNGQALQINKEELIEGIANWQTVEGDTPDNCKHIFHIVYHADANYTFQISYTDKAGNKNKAVNYLNSVTPNQFTVDKTAPTGYVKAEAPEGWNGQWQGLFGNLTFGRWSRFSITVTGMGFDETSPIESIQYYKDHGTAAKSRQELEGIKDWKPFTGFVIQPNEQFVVYLKITDYAGNVTYLNSDGMIVDNIAPNEEKIAPEISVVPEQPINGIYNSSVGVDIKVVDPVWGNTYSGIKEIRYEVIDLGEITQSGTLYAFRNTNPTQNELLQEWNGRITVDSQLNNSNYITVRVYAVDNADNSSYGENYIMIDTTAPIIDISYNEAESQPDSGNFYKANRVARIEIAERNFNEEDVKITVTKDGELYDYKSKMSGWSKEPGSGNGDDTKHIATIMYDEDGDYTFAIAYTDEAGNLNSGMRETRGTTNATEFTLDKTAPKITVNFDNNNVENEKYYKAGRNITIEVYEHNFTADRVEVTLEAKKSGEDVTVPDVSKLKWDEVKGTEDKYEATINLTDDGDYNFDVKLRDSAGNESLYDSNAKKTGEFTIDKKIEQPKFSIIDSQVTGTLGGAADAEKGISWTDLTTGRACKGKEIELKIDFGDTNFAMGTVTLSAILNRKNFVPVSFAALTVNEDTKEGSHSFTIEKKESEDGLDTTDGLYKIEAEFSDMAGNDTGLCEIIFSVNNCGSVYVYGKDLVDILEREYVKSVDKDIIIKEYSPEPLNGDAKITIKSEAESKTSSSKEIDFTTNEGELSKNENEKDVKEGNQWSQYTYTIAKSNFENPDKYTLDIQSKDKAGGDQESSNSNQILDEEDTQRDDGNVIFFVDTASPTVEVEGMEEKRVLKKTQTVNFKALDDRKIGDIKVTVDGVEQQINYTDDRGESKEGYFELAEGEKQEVRIEISDKAGNPLEKVYSKTITISSKWYVLWWDNQPLFWGSIVGIIVLIAAAAVGILYLKKRRNA